MNGTSAEVTTFISGALATGYAVAAVFFLEFWRQTGDRLFVFFAASFALSLLQRVALALATELVGNADLYYVVRLAALLLILVAIVDKNRSNAN